MSSMRTLTVLLGALSLLPMVSNADCPAPTPYTYFGLRDQFSSPPCNVSVPAPGIVTVQVIASTNPANELHITLPDPPGAILVNEFWMFPAIGNRNTGLTLLLGCSSAYMVGTLTYLFPAHPGFEIPWSIGDSSYVVDCDGNTQPSVVLTSNINGNADCWQNCLGLSPHSMYPPDGATGVPVDVEFTWVAVWGLELHNCSVRIGTTPDCSDAQLITVPCNSGDGIVLDFLQPSTTYYWQASWLYVGDGCSSGNFGVSPVHSFTTEGPLAVEPTTWGRVKTFYHD